MLEVGVDDVFELLFFFVISKVVNRMTTKSQHDELLEVRFTIPLTPPSVNHYKVPWWNAREQRIEYKITDEAIAFLNAIGIFAHGRSITPSTPRGRLKMRYLLSVKVVLGKGERGDGDNFWKCIADGLQDAGVIHSDARVRTWLMEVDDEDRENPRTEIYAAVIHHPLWDLWLEFISYMKRSF